MGINDSWNPNNPTGGQFFTDQGQGGGFNFNPTQNIPNTGPLQGQGIYDPFQNTNQFSGGTNPLFSNQSITSNYTPSQAQAITQQNTPAQTQTSTSSPNQNTGGGGGMVGDSGSAGYTPPSNQMLDPRIYGAQGSSSDQQRIAGGYTLATNNPDVFINPQTGGTWNTPGMGYVDNASTFGTNPNGSSAVGNGGGTLYNLPGGQYLADPKTGKVTPIQQQMQQAAQQAQTPSQDQGGANPAQQTPSPLGPGGINPQSQEQQPQLQQLLQILLGGGNQGSFQQNPYGYQQMQNPFSMMGGGMGMNPMAMMLMGQNPFAQMMMGGMNPYQQMMQQNQQPVQNSGLRGMAQPSKQDLQQLQQAQQVQQQPQVDPNNYNGSGNPYGLTQAGMNLWGY